MARLTWTDNPNQIGISRGVFFTPDGIGQAWNGLTSVINKEADSNSGAYYQDGRKQKIIQRPGLFAATISAYAYPPGFEDILLTAQRPKLWGLSYRVRIKDKYKIHLVYNAMLLPTPADYDQRDATSFTFDFVTRPVAIPEAAPTSHLVIDTSIAYPAAVTAFEAMIYGDDQRQSYLPTPQEVYDIFEQNALLRVIDNGDGTYTITGPDSAIVALTDPTNVSITWDSVVQVDSDSYRISSL